MIDRRKFDESIMIGDRRKLIPDLREPQPRSRQLPRTFYGGGRVIQAEAQAGYPPLTPVEEGQSKATPLSAQDEVLYLLRRIAWLQEATEGEIPTFMSFEANLTAGAQSFARVDFDCHLWAAWARIDTGLAAPDAFRLALGTSVPTSPASAVFVPGAVEVAFNKAIMIPGAREVAALNVSASHTLHVFLVALGGGAHFMFGS